MKHQLDIQFFGGRGQYLIPSPKRGGVLPPKRGESARNGAMFVQFPELRDALGKKGLPINMADAAEGANPFWDERSEPYRINCQRCVVAYELRRRGYDVVAQPNPNDRWAQLKRGKNGDLYSLWRGAFRHAKTDNVLGHDGASTYDNIVRTMKSYGNGSRAVIEFLRGSGGGHVVSVENRNGRIYFLEPQADTRGGGTGRVYSRDGFLFQMGNSPRHAKLTRTDNLQVSYRASQFVDQKSHIRGE